MTEAEEKQRKMKEKDLNSMTPSEMIAKYGVDDPDVKKRINDINNGISYTALGSVLQTSGTTIAGEHLEKGVQKVGSMYGENVSNSIWTNRYSITMPDGLWGRPLGQH